ncbi:hypothetical protein [Streptosporangium sp. NPDC049376]|uniref:hypothetical protein n=1 Tax=Streptosporangium sp. NPDC049376 TaxID=3366192 RepID=UPI0037873D6E
MITESRGVPLTPHLTGGDIADRTAFDAVMAAFRMRRRTGLPRTRPDRLPGDKGHSSKRPACACDGAASRRSFPSEETRSPIASARAAGVAVLDLVERCFAKLKRW